MRYLLAVMLLCLTSCGGGSIVAKKTNPPPVSAWTGTYSGTINLKGCPATGPCGGDAVTIKISDPFVGPEFSTAITATGTQGGAAFTATGTVLDDSPAPSGPGSSTETAWITTSLGSSLELIGTASSFTSAPMLVTAVKVDTYIVAGGEKVPGAYVGNLTRQ